MTNQKHISDIDIQLFQSDQMETEETLTFLEHISTCEYCSQRFATMMSEDLITAPKDLKSNILRATKSPDYVIASKARNASKRMQLFLYSVKVATATAFALLLLTLTMNYSGTTDAPKLLQSSNTTLSVNNKNNIPFATVLRDNMDSISNRILNFSNNIINMEVQEHD